LPTWKRITTNYTATNLERLIVDTTGGTVTVSLPISPVEGYYIQITEGDGWEINDFIVDPNGATIEGYVDNLLVDLYGSTVEFIYDGSTWQFTATTGPDGYTGSQGDIGYTGSSAPSYSTTIGNGTSTTFLVTHSLNKTNIIPSVRDTVSNYFVYPDIVYTDANNLTVNFVSAPSTSQYLVCVIGF
jgi:hypothetical protein